MFLVKTQNLHLIVIHRILSGDFVKQFEKPTGKHEEFFLYKNYLLNLIENIPLWYEDVHYYYNSFNSIFKL